jgi:CRP/FNR family transcriptional regulator, cyclic AMP receptor protein
MRQTTNGLYEDADDKDQVHPIRERNPDCIGFCTQSIHMAAEENTMTSRTKDKVRGRTKERLGTPMNDPTLEGKDENKVGRIQAKNGFVNSEALITGIFHGKTIVKHEANGNIFRQGQPADSLFYLLQGKVKLIAVSPQGKEAVLAVLGAGEFIGEGCLVGQRLRIATAVAITDCTVHEIEKSAMVRMLHEQHDISELFIKHLLSRSIRSEADLIGQILNSSEMRLARILLQLAHFGKESRTESVVPTISQDTLAQMVGITRSKVGQFMKKFEGLGFIVYKGHGLKVNSSLLSVVLHD